MLISAQLPLLLFLCVLGLAQEDASLNRMNEVPELSGLDIDSMNKLKSKVVVIPLNGVATEAVESDHAKSEIARMVRGLLTWVRRPFAIQHDVPEDSYKIFLTKLNFYGDILLPEIKFEFAGMTESKLWWLRQAAKNEMVKLNKAVLKAFRAKLALDDRAQRGIGDLKRLKLSHEEPASVGAEELQRLANLDDFEKFKYQFVKETVVHFGRMAHRILGWLTEKPVAAKDFLGEGGIRALTTDRYFELAARGTWPRIRAISSGQELSEKPENLQLISRERYPCGLRPLPGVVFGETSVSFDLSQYWGNQYSEKDQSTITTDLAGMVAASMVSYAAFLIAHLKDREKKALETVTLVVDYADVMLRGDGITAGTYQLFREQLQKVPQQNHYLGYLRKEALKLEQARLICWRFEMVSKEMGGVRIRSETPEMPWGCKPEHIAMNKKNTALGIHFGLDELHLYTLEDRRKKKREIETISNILLTTEGLRQCLAYIAVQKYFRIYEDASRKDHYMRQVNPFHRHMKNSEIDFSNEEASAIGSTGSFQPEQIIFVATKVFYHASKMQEWTDPALWSITKENYDDILSNPRDRLYRILR